MFSSCLFTRIIFVFYFCYVDRTKPFLEEVLIFLSEGQVTIPVEVGEIVALLNWTAQNQTHKGRLV